MIRITRNAATNISLVIPDQKLVAVTSKAGADVYVTIERTEPSFQPIVGQTPRGGVLYIEYQEGQ
jgi:hypothetical protein